ncbi:hypothetical protein AAFF_G00040780 [Aldrovandia affinis]|uniref:Uncharacterized protein n=1 Tax=Aldrovandia affinis TaxID=143900 RepID=A0AAD7S302_9TELE|nr:hypothetical protein AAFF_G00040780 [Aldrovandia affinis]
MAPFSNNCSPRFPNGLLFVRDTSPQQRLTLMRHKSRLWFMIFLTVVVERMFLLRRKSAIWPPIGTMMVMTRWGRAESMPTWRQEVKIMSDHLKLEMHFNI